LIGVLWQSAHDIQAVCSMERKTMNVDPTSGWNAVWLYEPAGSTMTER